MLTLPDIIRMNQLVRGEINFSGFQQWYQELPNASQSELVFSLYEFAFQAGCNSQTLKEVCSATGLSEQHPLIEAVKSFNGSFYSPKLGLMTDWVLGLRPAERELVFRFGVFLFGIAEGQVFRAESEEACNHWWHRDLKDERVVQAILEDPLFYMTAMRDDKKVQKRLD